MGCGAFIIRILLVIGIFLIESNAGYTEDIPQPVMCYDCNSEYDPRCGDPFDNYTIGLINCLEKRRPEHMKNAQPVLCRKMVQKVQGNTRVIRGCGYITDEDHDDKMCFKRSGTHDVQVTYCACTGAKCNGGHTSYPTASMIIVGAIFAALTTPRVA